MTTVTSNTIISSSSCLFAFLAAVALRLDRFTLRKAAAVFAVMAGARPAAGWERAARGAAPCCQAAAA